jgi:hypothetical protein
MRRRRLARKTLARAASSARREVDFRAHRSIRPAPGCLGRAVLSCSARFFSGDSFFNEGLER